MANNFPDSIEKYIAGFSGEQARRLQQIYELIRTEIPGADESISYAMPTFKLHGKPVVYFAGFTHHIGLYATPDGHAEFEKELSMYKRGKGSVQFPMHEPLPLDLIKRMVRFRATHLAEK